MSGVATARPVGEQRPCWDSGQHPWLCLQPAFDCPSTLPLLPGGGTLGTSDLKQHSYAQMEQVWSHAYRRRNGFMEARDGAERPWVG